MQFLAGSALVHAGILALLWSLPPDAQALALDNDLNGTRLVQVSTKGFEAEKKEIEPGGSESGDANADEPLMGPPKGTTGRPEETATSGTYTIKKRTDTAQLSRSEAVDRASRSGVLEFLDGGDSFANVTVGTADFSSGFGQEDVRGGLDGDIGAVNGSWGSWGVYNGVGTGPGYGTNKAGKLRWGMHGGTCDPGQKCSGGLKYGTGSGPGLGPRKPKGPEVTISRASRIGGGADPAIVRRYIRRKLPRIRHCYERALISNPDLHATITTQFLISPTGAVQGARAKGSGDAKLDGCVKSAVASIQFPKFGHVVNVTYPFTVRPAG